MEWKTVLWNHQPVPASTPLFPISGATPPRAWRSRLRGHLAQGRLWRRQETLANLMNHRRFKRVSYLRFTSNIHQSMATKCQEQQEFDWHSNQKFSPKPSCEEPRLIQHVLHVSLPQTHAAQFLHLSAPQGVQYTRGVWNQLQCSKCCPSQNGKQIAKKCFKNHLKTPTFQFYWFSPNPSKTGPELQEVGPNRFHPLVSSNMFPINIVSCVHEKMYLHTYTQIYVYIYVCVCIHAYIYITHVYIYNYIHPCVCVTSYVIIYMCIPLCSPIFSETMPQAPHATEPSPP